MTWHAALSLHYTREADRTLARFAHNGPLRVLQSLYPEGPAICHTVIVHPPGGLVGGDSLALDFSVGEGAHGLVTTPGATRFYRSSGLPAAQRVRLTLAGDARLEWLPLESIAYSGCLAENELTLQLAPGSELMGWDLTALGLPAAGQPFERGCFSQRIEVPGVWLERARIRADDTRLLHSPLGLAGHACLATLYFASGSPLTRARRQRTLDVARDVIASHALASHAGATSPSAQVVVVRVLAAMVEPALGLLQQIRQAWRAELWALADAPPRIWAT
jgi:urease accessory protein